MLLILRSPFDKLRANGAGVKVVEDFPFVLSPWFDLTHHPELVEGSKHEEFFFQQPASSLAFKFRLDAGPPPDKLISFVRGRRGRGERKSLPAETPVGVLMDSFNFYTKLDQTLLLGIKARDVNGLLEGIRKVPDSSIYYHTHRYLHQHHYLSPEPPNDFAYWVTEVLGDSALGERLWSVDIVQFHSIAELREEFATILERHLASTERRIDCPQGQEFHFMASRIYVLPTTYVAHNLAEFAEILGRVSVNSLYYHVFDAKLRLEHGENDFSRWFRSLGKSELAEKSRRLDPYSYTLEGLRREIIALVARHDRG